MRRDGPVVPTHCTHSSPPSQWWWLLWNLWKLVGMAKPGAICCQSNDLKLQHHIGNEWVCNPKSTNISTSQTMWPRGGSKGSSHCHLPATTREGRSRGMEYIVGRCCGTGSEIRSSTEQPAQWWKTKTPRTFSCWHPLWVLEEGDEATIHGLLCCTKWTHDC